MATVDMTDLYDSTAPYAKPSAMAGGVAQPYLVEVELDFAEAVTEKGSALASGDVIQVISVGAGTLILGAGMLVTEEHTGTSTDTGFDLGITGGDVDQWVDGFDFDGASLGDYAAVAAGAELPTVVTAADTIDLLIAAMTGTTTGGKLRVWALLLDLPDVSESYDPGIAALGS